MNSLEVISIGELERVTAQRITEIFSALTEFESEIGTCLQISRKQRGMPGYDPRELLQMVKAWTRILAGVPLYAIPASFDEAIANHELNTPFEAAEVVHAWRGMSEAQRQALYEQSGPRLALPAGPPCRWCNGRGRMRVRWVGCYLPRTEPVERMLEPVFWDSPLPSDGLIACAHPDAPPAEVLPEEAREFSVKEGIKRVNSSRQLKQGASPVVL